MRRPGRLPDGRPGPFLKWAGGKAGLLAQYAPHLPARIRGTYHEPFLGGGAVFFHVAPRRARLSDVNEELVNCWQAVQRHPAEVVAELAAHRARHDKEHFYEVRAADLTSLTGIERAARFIYLNRTCFNGLYRVNSRGVFNVPMGKYVNPLGHVDEAVMTASRVLRDAIIEVRPFERVLDAAVPGDFVYFDPPYMPVSKTSYFTSYSKDQFAEEDQRRLAEVFGELTRKGVRAALSNSDHPLIRSLYRSRRRLRVIEVEATRAINSDAARRGVVAEVLVVNW